jgi:alpha-D-xyloside xylohydrolase
MHIVVKHYDGGQMITVDTPIEVIPVFLRDGKQEYLINKI